MVVLMQNSVTRRIKCDEPQTIYELMQKNGFHCSTVWNSVISVSAKAPCTALVDQGMNIVSVNSIPEWDRSSFAPDTSQISGFYHTMKYIKMHAQRKALRYLPYERINAPFPRWKASQSVERSERPESQSVERPERSERSERPESLREEEEDENPIPVAIYYEEPLEQLKDVIAADGRFFQSSLDLINNKCVAEVEKDNDIVLSGNWSYHRHRCKVVKKNNFVLKNFCFIALSWYRSDVSPR